MRNAADRFILLNGMRTTSKSCTSRPALGNVPTYRSDYRSRIYQYYLKPSLNTITPESIGSLVSRSHQIKKIIRDHFPEDRNASILDLGCGRGAFIHFIREARYIDVSGIDRSPQQVEAANRLGVNDVLEGDIVETLRSLPKQSKYVIIIFDVLEQFTKDEMLDFVDEVYRVLRNGGNWIIHTQNVNLLLVGGCFLGIINMNWPLPAIQFLSFFWPRDFQRFHATRMYL
jgi:SAM-dependent methyltransferase